MVVGLIKPSLFKRFTKKDITRKQVGLIFGGSTLVFFVLTGGTAPGIQPVQEIEIAIDIQDIKEDENVIVNTGNEEEINVEDIVPQNLNQSQQDISLQTDVDNQSVTIKTIEPQHTYYSVVSVTDGDTLKISIDGTTKTLRLIGMDTPETVDPRKPVQCFGKEASNKAKELLSGQKVRIETDSTQGELDKYGRMLVYIWRQDGLFFNEYMIKQGYANEYTYDLPYKYQSDFKSAQTYARENQLGLWSPKTCSGDTSQSAESTSTTQGKYYTSSYHSSKYYYPASCSAWQGLSENYLESFDSLEDLLSSFPSRTLSPQCQ